ncbi:MAG: hypothetical protein E7585_00925 [Ruminococcaceae bacterium]|nr:hypothetical protein [Oscillospiraceae bacterium]
MREKRNATLQNTKRLVESALMVAVATALSLFTVVQMPYGGSVTVASMLPILLIAYRHGLGWGLGTGVVYAVLQQLLGLSNLSYFTTWQSIVAIILLDYLLAFTVAGLGGVFRQVIKQQNWALVCGALLASVLRYACHVISGATVWAGLSIPTQAALLYSFGYNATYMIPETIVLVLAAFYLGSVLDFRREQPVRMSLEHGNRLSSGLTAAVAALGVIVAAVDVVLIAPHMQNAESGAFDFSGFAVESFVDSFWLPVVIVTVIGVATALGLLIAKKRLSAQSATADGGNALEIASELDKDA